MAKGDKRLAEEKHKRETQRRDRKASPLTNMSSLSSLTAPSEKQALIGYTVWAALFTVKQSPIR